METPWGSTHSPQQLDDDVFLITTNDNGGLLITQETARMALSEKARHIGQIWHDFLAFEQHEAMMVVFYEHPEWYPWVEEELTSHFAEDSLRHRYPDYF
jgi:hypothetical protein